MKKSISIFAIAIVALSLSSCKSKDKKVEQKSEAQMEKEYIGTLAAAEKYTPKSDVNLADKVKNFAVVKLTSDINHLSAKEKEMLSYLFDAAQIMDDIYWMQTLGQKDAFLSKISDETLKRFAQINYGPWERLGGNKSFINEIGEKPAGANFYPADITKEEFEKLADSNKTSLYTLIRRNEDKSLRVVWYHDAYADQIQQAAELLKKAAGVSENADFKKYLELRAEALLTDKYFESDIAWMNVKNSNIDFVIGPIENYEDALFGYKAAAEAFILIKDLEWSKKLARFAALLPQLQKAIPTDEAFKKEIPGLDSDMGVYDAVFYAGDCNAGSKTIAINLPNDEKVQLQKGTRKLQLKNSMKAKFDNMVMPISNILISEAQRKYIKFDAFFENVMFHEVAHGLGIKNTINGKGTVREALKEQFSGIEEGKADIMGLWLVSKLYDMKELSAGEVNNNYVTFVSGIFRSIRFGAASAHGKANLACYNFLVEKQAIKFNEKDQTYTIDFNNMKKAVAELVNKVMTLEATGDYEGTKKWIEGATIGTQLQKDLDRIKNANIPVDIVFEKGKANLGLK
ncbi:MAG: Zn-dependent hydrolase [Bacteroidota bacterium]